MLAGSFGQVGSSPFTAAALLRFKRLKNSKSTCAFTRSPKLNRFAIRISIFTNAGAVWTYSGVESTLSIEMEASAVH